MVVQMGPSSSADSSCRFGLTVTKKTARSAVLRNRMRRRLRAAALAVLPEAGVMGRDVVLIGRLPAAEIPYDQLLKDLRWCLKRLTQGGEGA
jgi:ribonuclease P protein component